MSGAPPAGPGRAAPPLPLPVVSKLDDTPTAMSIREHEEFAHRFETIVVSDEVGRLRRLPVVIQSAFWQLGVSASEAIYAGETRGSRRGGSAGRRHARGGGSRRHRL